MIFDDLPVEAAAGAILAHTWRGVGRVLKKGRRLGAEDLNVLAAGGETNVAAARLEPCELHEDPAAAQIARALCGAHLQITEAFTGRCNLAAEQAGVLLLEEAAIRRINQIDEAVTVATLPLYAVVRPRQVVATVKIIPFAVAESCVGAAVEALQSISALRVAPFRPKRVAALFTHLPGYKQSLLEKAERVLAERLDNLGATLAHVAHARHDKAAVGTALRALVDRGCDLAVIGGATAIMDRRDVVPAALTQIGGEIERFGMPVDPGNLLLLGRLGALPVVAMPGCARSIKENGFDWVLARLVADLPLTSSDIAEMGVGGLLEETMARILPRETAVERAAVEERTTTGNQRRVAAVVLAAGRSSRMGAPNKLLAHFEGEPLVRRAVRTALASRAEQVVVVTGHQAEAVEAAVADLDVTIVHNENHASGLSASLRQGLAAVAPQCAGAVICLADMPLVRAEHLDRLIEAFEPEAERAICVACHKGRRGNPVLWARPFFEELMALSGDRGGRRLMERHGDCLLEVDMDDAAVLRDVDRPEDLQQITGMSAERLPRD